MEARQDDLRRALMKARMPVPACAVMEALQQNPDAGADEVIKILCGRDKFIAANCVICFLCRRGIAAIAWMPHTRDCKLKAKRAGPSALPKAARLVSVDPDSKVAPNKLKFHQHKEEVKLAAASAMGHPDRTPSPPWTPRRHQEMGHPAGPPCADVPLPRWFSLIQL